MKTLEEAWAWYNAVTEGMRRLAHLAKYWSDFPWGQADAWVTRVERDNVLRHVEAFDLTSDAKTVTDEHDDLAVLVLFSVFEAIVRDHLKDQLIPEINQLQHPSLKKAGKDVLEAVEHGSFGLLLQAFKLEEKEKNLVEQVNQIRAHRNWVAHGRRPEMKPAAYVEPRDAYERLSQFLKLILSLNPTNPLSGTP